MRTFISMFESLTTMNQINEFQPFMKVYLQNEYGVVVNQFIEIDEKHFVTEIRPQVFPIKLYGLIRRDTSKVSDFEDWRGLWGSFVDAGGHEISRIHQFTFINDDGTLKN